MVARIKADMDKVDAQLTLAEGTMEGTGSTAALKSYMPSFLVSNAFSLPIPNESRKLEQNINSIVLCSFQVSRSSVPPAAFEESNSPEYSPVDVFSTEDFFPKQTSSSSHSGS